MTITTARLARAVSHAWARAPGLPPGLPLALVALLVAPAAHADWAFVPTLTLRQTYTDNVAQQSDELARSQLVTEISPGFELKHQGPRLTVNARSGWQYYYMPDKDIAGTNRTSRYLQADAQAKLVDQLLYVDAMASRGQQSISQFGQLNTGSNYASANRTEVATWRISPYLVHRFGSAASSELRYTRDSVDAGRTGLGNTDGDTLSFSLNSGPAYRQLTWGLQLMEQKIHEQAANDSNVQTASANLGYQVRPTLKLTAGLGYDNYDYESLGGANGGKAWNAGFAWTPSRRTSLTGTFGRRYYGPSRSLNALHRSRHTNWSIVYDDSVQSTRSNFLMPATISTADLLDGLFTPNYPDPIARARAIEAYMLATNLPPSLDQSINYFSNRYSLQKQLRASVGFRQGRTNAMFSAFRVRRSALSVRETDSELLGSSSNSINDNTSQKGLSATLDYRLTGRTSLNLSSDILDNQSLSTGLQSRSSAVRFGMRHQLRAKLSATIDLRHVEGSTAILGGRAYTENAISASLSMQL